MTQTHTCFSWEIQNVFFLNLENCMKNIIGKWVIPIRFQNLIPEHRGPKHSEILWARGLQASTFIFCSWWNWALRGDTKIFHNVALPTLPTSSHVPSRRPCPNYSTSPRAEQLGAVDKVLKAPAVSPWPHLQSKDSSALGPSTHFYWDFTISGTF